MSSSKKLFHLTLLTGLSTAIGVVACGSDTSTSGASAGAGGTAGSTSGAGRAGSSSSGAGGGGASSSQGGALTTGGGGASTTGGGGATASGGGGATSNGGSSGNTAGGTGGAQGGSANTDPCTGTYLLCDDFNASQIDTAKWTIGDVEIAHKYPVRPSNVALGTTDDNGTAVTVVDATSFGDQHAAAPRQGGLLITKDQYGGGRYEARMKSLPGPNGCTCLWNYYDSLNDPSPPATRVYTEIDIEMPAHVATPPAWSTWARTLGFNTWSHTDADADAKYIDYPSPTVNPFDGKFHVFRWDWHDGSNGALKLEWYVDGILQSSTTEHISDHPAQLWVGTWPAPWPGMVYDFDIVHMYIDWVRIAAL